MILTQDRFGTSLPREEQFSESCWPQNYITHTSNAYSKLGSQHSATICTQSRSRHRHIEAQTGFTVPPYFRHSGPQHSLVSSTSPSISPHAQGRLDRVQISTFMLKRRRSRIINIENESRVSLWMLDHVPLQASLSKSDKIDHGLRSKEAPKILRLTDKWVAVDKPPGILVHRTKLYPPGVQEKYLTDFVTHLVHKETGVVQKVFPVQRLDRPTSGVIVFALGCAENAFELQAALKSQDCVKQYWALAFGAHMPKRWVNDHPLKDIDGKKRKQRNARTEFEVIEVFNAADVVAVSARLTTGRRHQVRRHLSNSKHPILGDTSYCKGKLNRMVRDIYEVKRCCLHSQTLCFKDPSTAEQMSIHAPLPSDLQIVLNHISNQ